MPIKQNKLLYNPFFIAGIIVILTMVVAGQNFLSTSKAFDPNAAAHTHYNNYLIFKKSYYHLIEHKDLYQLYPQEHWDYYKYSPTFALLMAPFTVLPDVLGLFIWDLLNASFLFFAIWKLPGQSAKIRSFILGFVLLEMITAMENSQSNSLLAGLIILAFVALEGKQTALAALCIVFTVFIKLFGIVALVLFMLYPGKLKAILYTAGWTILLLALPLLVISSPQLIFLYSSWLDLLRNDHAISTGLSVAGWLYSWFHVEYKGITVLVGALLLCLPLLNRKAFTDLKFKLFYLSSILIWIVIFNHKAESPTFVIAVSGVAIWYFSQKMKVENLILLIGVFVFTVLSPTDVFPTSIRENLVVPYVLKALPCILVWLKITWDLILYKQEGNPDALSQSILRSNER